MSASPAAASPIQRAAQEQVDAELDRIVTEALERHDRDTATANIDPPRQRRTGNANDGRATGRRAERRAGASTGWLTDRQRVRGTARDDRDGASGWGQLSARRGVSATSRRSGSVAGRRRTRRGRRPGSGSRGRASSRASRMRSPRWPTRPPGHGTRSARSSSGRFKAVGSSRLERSRGGRCGRSAAMRRAARAGPGAIRISRSRHASRTRSSRAYREARCAARSAPAPRCLLARSGSARSGAERPATRATSGPLARIRHEPARRMIA